MGPFGSSGKVEAQSRSDDTVRFFLIKKKLSICAFCKKKNLRGNVPLDTYGLILVEKRVDFLD